MFVRIYEFRNLSNLDYFRYSLYFYFLVKVIFPHVLRVKLITPLFYKVLVTLLYYKIYLVRRKSNMSCKKNF